MGKEALSVLFAAVMAFLPAAPTVDAIPALPAGGYRCLAVGMDLFVSEEATTPCSANNAEAMAALLTDCLPEGTRVTRRVNGPGNAKEMEQAISEAFGEAGEEDTSILYLSTHGIIWEEDGEIRSALMISDGIQEEALDPKSLRIMMDRIPGKKVLILDCCHAGAIAESFRGTEWQVLAGSESEEDCYFWAAGEATGMGYFTAALENALRASAPQDIDPDGDGMVSIRELEGRIREIYGISHAVFLPEGEEEMLFVLPEDRAGTERIRNLRFDPVTEENGQVSISFHFLTETAVQMEYRLVPADGNGWDFENTARLPDRERSGQKRGMLSPGEKDRTVRISREKLGESGRALLQIVSFRGLHGQIPVMECTIAVGGGEP